MAFLVTIAPGTVVYSERIEQFSTASLSMVQVGINITAVSGTSPTLQPYLEVLGSDGVWYEVWKPSALTATGQTFATLGEGQSNGAVFAAQARLRFEVTGTSPSFTLSADVHGH